MTRQLSEIILHVRLLQAPTGSVAGPELCAAVSEAGALGALGLTWTEPETAREAIADVRARTDAPFQVNFALHFEPRSLDVALDSGVPVITFSWGDAAPFTDRCHRAGAAVGVQVTSGEGARRAVASGADFLIAQGSEAGGHVQATSSLDALLPGVLALAGAVPVVAAGGIATAGQVRRYLDAGAAAVMCGTRFVATQESRAHPEYKAALVAATADDTALTVCFDGGWPYAAHRVLRNRTLREWEAAGSPPVGRRPGEGDVLAHTTNGEPIYRYEDTAPRIGMTGRIEEMCLYAGTSVAHIRDLPTAAEVVARLTAAGA
ncbi:MAG: nitronate monooxygenase [Capsulimonadales bacterium]|nr:nitronate monooxygenase [Capsulimonadales bacterium]